MSRDAPHASVCTGSPFFTVHSGYFASSHASPIFYKFFFIATFQLILD